jgi:hypothetical protein
MALHLHLKRYLVEMECVDMDIKIQNDIAQAGGSRASNGARENSDARKISGKADRRENIDRDTVSIQGAQREGSGVDTLRDAEEAKQLTGNIASNVSYDQLLSAHVGLDPDRIAALLDEEA